MWTYQVIDSGQVWHLDGLRELMEHAEKQKIIFSHRLTRIKYVINITARRFVYSIPCAKCLN